MVTGAPSSWNSFLLELDQEHEKFPFDLRANTERFAQLVLAFLFPQFRTPEDCAASSAERFEELADILDTILNPLAQASSCKDLASKFKAALPEVRTALLQDAEAILNNDPAAESLNEVVAAYPGFYAIALHRIAHKFYHCGVPLFPRLLAEHAHSQTGIDIHPGAEIGPSFSIDHGTGIVIGETAELGSGVRLFQGVTLGALIVDKSKNGVKRHPTLEDGVIVYANATILGGETVIGQGSTIGGNVWLTRSVPPNSIITSSKSKAAQTISDDSIEFHI